MKTPADTLAYEISQTEHWDSALTQTIWCSLMAPQNLQYIGLCTSIDDCDGLDGDFVEAQNSIAWID